MSKHRPPTPSTVVRSPNIAQPTLANLTLNQLRLLFYCLAYYRKGADGRARYTITITEYEKMFPGNGKDVYKRVKDDTKAIMANPFEVQTDKGEMLVEAFIEGLYYGKGWLSFRLGMGLIELLEKDAELTFSQMMLLQPFKSKYSYLLYLHGRRWLARGHFEASEEYLRKITGTTKKHLRWNTFRQKVLDPAFAEIKEKSDIKMLPTFQKAGNKVTGVAMRIIQKPPKGVIDVETTADGLFVLLLQQRVSHQKARNLADLAMAQGKVSHCIRKVSEIKNRWRSRERVGQWPNYLAGAIKSELAQMDLPFSRTEQMKKNLALNKLASEALQCYEATGCTGVKNLPKCEVCTDMDFRRN